MAHMAPDSAAAAPVADCEVMASVEGDGGDRRFIIAELCRDDAWLSVSVDATADVADWR